MQKQIEITKTIPLLKEDGTLTQAGWCRHNLFEYNRENITAPKWRIKEWDFYQIANRDYMIQITFFNISFASTALVSFINFVTGERIEDTIFTIGTIRRHQVNRNGEKPYKFLLKKGKKEISFDVTETKRHLYYKSPKIEIEFFLDRDPKCESITIATPFKVPNRFFLTQKINCMPAHGTVKFNNRIIELNSDDLFAVLDWGRGPWLHKNYWFWGNGATYIDGKIFGFEITWGIGNEENATETAIIYDGVCHKLGRVTVKEQPDGRWMQPWEFTEENGRFEVTMTPYYNNEVGTIIGPVGMKTHQVHGLWNGTATLDDGTVLEIKDMYAFCEKVYNKW